MVTCTKLEARKKYNLMVHEDSWRSTPSTFMLQAHPNRTSPTDGSHRRAGRWWWQTLLITSVYRGSRRLALRSHRNNILVCCNALQYNRTRISLIYKTCTYRNERPRRNEDMNRHTLRMRIRWKKSNSPKGTVARKDTAVHRAWNRKKIKPKENKKRHKICYKAATIGTSSEQHYMPYIWWFWHNDLHTLKFTTCFKGLAT